MHEEVKNIVISLVKNLVKAIKLRDSLIVRTDIVKKDIVIAFWPRCTIDITIGAA